jgi:hypothetical protein
MKIWYQSTLDFAQQKAKERERVSIHAETPSLLFPIRILPNTAKPPDG